MSHLIHFHIVIIA